MSPWAYILGGGGGLIFVILLYFEPGGGGGGTPYIMDYTGRLHPKGAAFSGWRYIKGWGF